MKNTEIIKTSVEHYLKRIKGKSFVVKHKHRNTINKPTNYAITNAIEAAKETNLRYDFEIKENSTIELAEIFFDNEHEKRLFFEKWVTK